MNQQKRSAGVLMHITSLPSPYGIGDMGPQAKAFADFLHRSRQTYWQILPLNPTDAEQGHSPYSSISSRAGNTLLISPDLLADEGLIDQQELLQWHKPMTDKVDYATAFETKQIIFSIVWDNFQRGQHQQLKDDFFKFCKQEADWLIDYVAYTLLKKKFDNQPWYNWPESYKNISLDINAATSKNNINNVENLLYQETAFLQFIFFKQWQQLRSYCKNLAIQFYGDLPFYASYDSADVWKNRELFSLNDQAQMVGVAGVPPDAFSEDGQLWGMPVFRWDVLEKTGYQWWIERIKKNMELYDLLRLDHFRAFADYWDVPATSSTAKNGTWKKGPGHHFFEALKKELSDLPFVAEDLGDINEPVHQLRNDFDFPGMKILQFAFGYDMPHSIYIPHNYSSNFVVYTGTHDNNTITGWFRQEGRQHQLQMEHYFGMPLSEKNIHLIMGRLAYSSVAKIAILPMQDILGLNEQARMNMPGSTTDNWKWRLLPGQITTDVELRLKEWVELYNRKN